MSLTLTPSRQLPEVDAFIQCAMVMEAQPFLDALAPLPGSDAVETLVVGATPLASSKATPSSSSPRELVSRTRQQQWPEA